MPVMPSFFVLAPALVLLLGSAAVGIMRLFRSTTGFTWLAAVLASVIAWLLVVFTRFQLPLFLEIPGWQSLAGYINSVGFTADRLSWPVEMALSTLVLGVVFTDSARYAQLTRAGVWSASLALTALGMLTSLASGPLICLLGWTTLDIVEMILTMGQADSLRSSRQSVTSLGYKLAGSVLILYTILKYPALDSAAGVVVMDLPSTFFMLFGLSLRLGALPLHPPFYKDLPLRRGLGTIMRLTPVAPALVYLARFTPDRLRWSFVPAMLVLLAVAAFYGAWMWLRADNELSGRPFWIITISSLAVSGAIRGHNESVIAWGIVLLLSGGILFLFSARERRLLYIPALGLIGFSGLPFTPAASSWAGLTGQPLPGLTFVYLVSLALLMIGYYRKSQEPGDSLAGMERWVSLVYPLGLLVMILTLLVMGYAGWPGSRTTGIWWAGLASLLMAAAGILIADRQIRLSAMPGLPSGFGEVVMAQVRSGLRRFFEFAWLVSILDVLYKAVSWVVTGVAFLLEGEAGILWTLLFLTLFITVVSAGQP